MPKLDVDIGKGLACCNVDDLHIENHVHALLALVLLPQVAVDDFTYDPVWTFGDVRSEDA